MKENKPMQKQDLFSSTLSELIWEQIFWISGLKLAIYVQLKFWVIQLFISEGPGSNLVKNFMFQFSSRKSIVKNLHKNMHKTVYKVW